MSEEGGSGVLGKAHTPALMERGTRILMVEDDSDFASLLEKRMRAEKGKEAIRLEKAESLSRALGCLSKKQFDLILLDLALPDSSGLNSFLRVKKKVPDVPVVVLTGLDDEKIAMESLREGAQDYLLKGTIDGQNLFRKLHFAMERHRILKEWKKAWKTERSLATHDPLTGLPNRTLLQDRLQQAIAQARRHGEGLAFLFIDLDRFKHVNDTLGHPIGDLLLKTVAERLKGCVRAEDTVARWGGDEFAVLISDLKEGIAGAVVDRILKKIAEPYHLKAHKLFMTASIGISLCPERGIDPQTLVGNADVAMYEAKSCGGNRFEIFRSSH